MGEPAHRRFRGLPVVEALGREVPVATGRRSRLLGLAWLERDAAPPGLLIPRCASVHTFGMRFGLDLYFLDGEGRMVAVRRGIPARRVIRGPGAVAVLEVPAGEGGEIPAAPT